MEKINKNNHFQVQLNIFLQKFIWEIEMQKEEVNNIRKLLKD